MKPYPNFRDLEQIHAITWFELAELEPRLQELLWQARKVGGACRQWSEVDRAFAPIRNSLTELVGFGRRNPQHSILCGTEAYQVAYWKLYDAVAGLLRRCPGVAEEAPKLRRREQIVETWPVRSAAMVAATA
jgi:hypothetical protein